MQLSKYAIMKKGHGSRSNISFSEYLDLEHEKFWKPRISRFSHHKSVIEFHESDSLGIRRTFAPFMASVLSPIAIFSGRGCCPRTYYKWVNRITLKAAFSQQPISEGNSNKGIYYTTLLYDTELKKNSFSGAGGIPYAVVKSPIQFSEYPRRFHLADARTFHSVFCEKEKLLNKLATARMKDNDTKPEDNQQEESMRSRMIRYAQFRKSR